ncbi:MAG: DUF6351 family protein [Acidobacteria bacterium]|nr:DUF6351 family protein [Acidobacteriota bacterium]
MVRSVTITLLAVGMFVASVAAQQPADAPLSVTTLSSKAEFVSGGDVLLQVAGPANLTARNVTVRLNGQDVSRSFRLAADSRSVIGRVSGLEIGPNAIEASMRGQATAQLTVVNHPITGPVLYSPQQMPFVCETDAHGLGAPLDEKCSAETKVEYFYKVAETPAPAGQAPGDLAAADNANGFQGGAQESPFRPLDPEGPRPTDIAMTTTTEGKTVPYIVRREMGTINRAVYSIAFLHEPGTPLPSPWSNESAWNGRLVYAFGGGVSAGYHQGRTVGGLRGNRQNLEDGQLGDYPIAKGYALAGGSLNVFGTHGSDVVSAETMMMVKERFIEQFGVPMYTMGSGRSGGSMQQHLIGNNYPGLLDGIVPTASYADTLTFHAGMVDCHLLDSAMAGSELPWTIEDKTAVSGYSHFDYCTNNELRYSARQAANNCDDTTIPMSMRFNAETNPTGVRCTYHDSMSSVFGKDPQTGFARSPFDNVGVQYGLGAFNDGTINFAQFLDLNRRVGGHDVNGNIVAARSVGDPEALRRAYASGRINDTAHGLSMIPIIDMRPYTEGPGGNVHDTFSGWIARNRLTAHNGNLDNYVSRVYAPGAPTNEAQDANLIVLDAWLAAVAKDMAPGTQREKVIRNRPAGLVDSCFTAELEETKDAAVCAERFPVYANPRIVAGMPPVSEHLKCQLKPADRSDYSREVTDAQLASLRAVFPQGVCDYSKPGVGYGPPAGVWQTFLADAPSTSTSTR